MMKNIAKWFIFATILVLMPMKYFGQTRIESQNGNTTQQSQIREYENGFLFNIFEIENVEERVQLASALATSDIWLCTPTENPGELFIRPNSYNPDIPIYAEFDYLRMTLREEYEAAAALPKEEFREILNSWAHNISHDYFNFLIADHLDRANHCMDAEPFCTSDVYEFPALNSGYSWSGPNYGCLGSSPTNKHSFWYYMRIGVAGNITILIEASFDVDFALWGPFDDQIAPCPTEAGEAGMLTADCSSCPNNTTNPTFYPSGNLHDCSFDARHYEYANVVNGQVGQYYILLITNYSGSDGYITFQKYAGDGETDCGIMPGIATNDGPYCAGETINLFVNTQAGATYSWTGPNGFTSNTQNPTIPNCTYEMGGVYTCVTTVDGQTTSGTTEVLVYPQPIANFEATTACFGTATEFTSTATTNPSGQAFTHYHWDFGDGEESDEQNVTHTYAAAGTYQVTYTVQTGGRCEDQITQDVVVLAMPVATATVNPSSVQYGGVATLTADPGAEGSFSYHWEPANMVTNPNSQTTQTVPIQETQTFTCTVTNAEGDCSSTTQITVNMAGSDLTATATADQYELCEDEQTTLHAVPHNGTGNYTFNWSPANLLNNTTTQNPVATPPLGTTTFHCSVSDGLTIQEVSVTLTVHPKEEKDLYDSFCENGSYTFYGQTIHSPGVYDHTLQTQYGCDSVIHLHLSAYPIEESEFMDNEHCDSYFWDPQGHEILSTDHEGNDYDRSGTYHRTYADRHGCDSLVTMQLQLEYTPQPMEIYPVDPDNTYPHWVVTATEFQINAYEFKIWDYYHTLCHWDSIDWSFENPEIEWLLEPDSTTVPMGRNCTLYVLNYVEDTVWLRTTIYNECAPQGITQRYWFICSFYGIEDYGSSTCTGSFNVVPNPNNGTMTLNFESFTGKVEMKVYDMTGHLVDQFETYNAESSSMTYSMKGRADGIYFFVATSKDGTIAKKVIVSQ
jgi:PKD repeat protein